jgi:hypothetical protein
LVQKSKGQKVKRSVSDPQTLRPSDLQTFPPEGGNKFFDILVLREDIKFDKFLIVRLTRDYSRK